MKNQLDESAVQCLLADIIGVFDTMKARQEVIDLIHDLIKCEAELFNETPSENRPLQWERYAAISRYTIELLVDALTKTEVKDADPIKKRIKIIHIENDLGMTQEDVRALLKRVMH